MTHGRNKVAFQTVDCTTLFNIAEHKHRTRLLSILVKHGCGRGFARKTGAVWPTESVYRCQQWFSVAHCPRVHTFFLWIWGAVCVRMMNGLMKCPTFDIAQRHPEYSCPGG